jgi:hypothetical protein
MSICILRMWATQKLAARRTGPTQAAATIRWRCSCRRNASAVMEAGGSDAAGGGGGGGGFACDRQAAFFGGQEERRARERAEADRGQQLRAAGVSEDEQFTSVDSAICAGSSKFGIQL